MVPIMASPRAPTPFGQFFLQKGFLSTGDKAQVLPGSTSLQEPFPVTDE